MTYCSNFFGRSEDLKALKKADGTGKRLITICGPPGAGKTRLAHEWVSQLAGSEKRLVSFADMSEALAPGEMLARLAKALDVTFEAGLAAEAKAAQLADAMDDTIDDGRRRVLVIDNAETVLESLRELLAGWMEHLRGETTVLVTSRRPLGLEAERVHEIDGLQLPGFEEVEGELSEPSEAMALLIDRARMARPDFEVTEANIADLVRLVHLLDGFPLGLELAAARLRLLGAEELCRRLEETFEILRDSHAETARHFSLHTAIEVSWRLLAPFEARLLAACSVFRGGFDVTAAEAVMATSGDLPVLDALENLVDHHLLHFDRQESTPPRLRMYESVREFAADRLIRQGWRAEVEAHLIAYFGELARKRLPPARRLYQECFIIPLLREEDNFQASIDAALRSENLVDIEGAVDSALALSFVLSRSGHHDLALERLETLEGHGVHHGLDRGQLLRLRIERASLLMDLHRYQASLDLLDQVLQSSGEAGDELHTVQAALLSSQVCYYSERLDDGWRYLELAQAVSPEVRAPFEGPLALQEARLHYLVGHCSQSLSCLEACLKISREDEDFYTETLAIQNLALFFDKASDFEQSRIYFTMALDRHRRCGNRNLEAQTLNGLGVLYKHHRRHDEARRCFNDALKFFRQSGFRLGVATTLGNLGMVALDAGRPGQALELARKALSLCRADENIYISAGCRLCIGYSLGLEGRLDEAIETMGDALEGKEKLLQFPLRIKLHSALGAFKALRGERDEAKAIFDTVETALAEGEAPTLITMLATHRLHLDLCDYRQATKSGNESAAYRAGFAIVEGLHKITSEHRRQLSRCESARYALSLLESALSPSLLKLWRADQRARGHLTLIVFRRGLAFRPPNGEWVDLSGSQTPLKVFRALLDARRTRPGESVSAEELIAHTWPSQRLLHEAALSRLNAHLSRLRSTGLRAILVRTPEGYLFDPHVELIEVD